MNQMDLSTTSVIAQVAVTHKGSPCPCTATGTARCLEHGRWRGNTIYAVLGAVKPGIGERTFGRDSTEPIQPHRKEADLTGILLMDNINAGLTRQSKMTQSGAVNNRA